MSDIDEKILQELQGMRAEMSGIKADIADVKHGQQTHDEKLDRQDKKLDTLTTKVDRLEDHAMRINTVLKALPPRGEVEEIVDTAVNVAKNEIKADIVNLDAKVIRRVQRHEHRIINLEEHEGIENPEKN